MRVHICSGTKVVVGVGACMYAHKRPEGSFQFLGAIHFFIFSEIAD